MHRLLFALLVVPLSASAQDKSPPHSPGPPSSELIHVDGSKNPELVPQWSAWAFAFRLIAGGPGMLPTVVDRAVSKDEAAMILREAQAAQKIDPACERRMSRLRPLIGKEKASTLDAKARAITVDCRWRTLNVRDRVLRALRPEGQAALIAFVESTKAGTTFTLTKRQLPRFMEPE
jgi:hypothetical protein